MPYIREIYFFAIITRICQSRPNRHVPNREAPSQTPNQDPETNIIEQLHFAITLINGQSTNYQLGIVPNLKQQTFA